MNWDLWLKVFIGLFAALAGVLKLWDTYRGRPVRLGELKTILEIAELLPAGSEARNALIQNVEHRATVFIDDQEKKRRDPFGIVLAVAFLAGGGYATYIALTVNGWWWFLAGILITVGAFGLGQDGVRRERDNKGRPISYDIKF